MGLELERHLREAEVRTGLGDWGGDEFHEPLEQLLLGLKREARLTDEGFNQASSRISTMLANRLRLIEDRKRIPAIAREIIARPIFITGLPRAGTTHLHALLASDPSHRSARLWEILDPSPPARCDELFGGDRLVAVQASLEQAGFSSPEMRKVHATDASSAEECGFVFEYAAASRNFPAFWRLPSYAEYLEAFDHVPVYGLHRKFLQSAQWGCLKDRWVLKAPMHLFSMEALLAVYPDAIIVQSHRDPARIIPSITNFMSKLRALTSACVDPAEVASYNLTSWRRALDRMDAFRDRPENAGRVFDVHYLDLARDPLGVVERLYAHFSLPLTDAAREAMEDHVGRAGAEHQGGDYRMADYELSAERIEACYGDYVRRNGVEREDRS